MHAVPPMNKILMNWLIFSLSLALPISVTAGACDHLDECLIVGYSPVMQRQRMQIRVRVTDDAINRRMQFPVKFETARDHCQYLTLMQSMQLDIVQLPLSWVPYAVEILHYKPILSSDSTYSTMLISPNSQPIQTVDQLRGRHLGVQRNTFSAKEILRDKMGEELFSSVSIRSQEVVDLLLMGLLRGEVDAVLESGLMYRQLNEKQRKSLHVLPIHTDLPLIIMLGNPNTDSELLQQYIDVVLGKSLAYQTIMPELELRPAKAEDYNKVSAVFDTGLPPVDCSMANN